MTNITAAEIRKLREVSGAGMTDVKNALVAADGDFDQALTALREKGLVGVGKRAGRDAKNGLIHSYLHKSSPDLPPTVGVLVEVNCETDFVAKTPQFQELARELALHIASADPLYVRADQVPPEVIEAERRIYEAAAREEGKPDAAIAKIVDGKVTGYLKTACLVEQSWVKDNKKTIQTILDEAAAVLGEKVAVGRFARFRVGQA